MKRRKGRPKRAHLRSPPTSPVDFIVRKRDGGSHSEAEIEAFVAAFLRGDVADYQMSAWLMAAWLCGLRDDETVALTEAMLHSGDVLRLASVDRPKIDKHSTGGVGDKVSLCLAPLVAACGVAVPMISGRGLGHTGGTLDKLEAIPGYRTRLSTREFERVVEGVGCSIIGQTDRLAPADRRIYSLRDVTGTVESIPLIVASILSKKLAAGLDGLVLDVKVGRGAFMKDPKSARRLARALVGVSRRAGTPAVALLTNMSDPTGVFVGNALEVREAIDVLRGEGPPDTTELTLGLGAEMLILGRAAKTRAEARARLVQAVGSGAGLDRFRRMVEAQGGDPRAVDDPRRLPRTPKRVAVPSPRAGFVASVDALAIGHATVAMGAGRTRADQAVDPAVGIEIEKKRGDRVSRGEPLAWLHVRGAVGARLVSERVAAAFALSSKAPSRGRIVLERIDR